MNTKTPLQNLLELESGTLLEELPDWLKSLLCKLFTVLMFTCVVTITVTILMVLIYKFFWFI